MCPAVAVLPTANGPSVSFQHSSGSRARQQIAIIKGTNRQPNVARYGASRSGRILPAIEKAATTIVVESETPSLKRVAFRTMKHGCSANAVTATSNDNMARNAPPSGASANALPSTTIAAITTCAHLCGPKLSSAGPATSIIRTALMALPMPMLRLN